MIRTLTKSPLAINKLLLFGALIIGMISCNAENEKSVGKTDSIAHGSNELAKSEHGKCLSTSDSDKDAPDTANIARPSTSSIHTKLDTGLLFGIWTNDPDGPHADFKLTRKSFYVVDYDGNGDMPYQLNDNIIKIYYNDFIQEGKIISVKKDTLKILWKGSDQNTSFVRWPK